MGPRARRGRPQVCVPGAAPTSHGLYTVINSKGSRSSAIDQMHGALGSTDNDPEAAVASIQCERKLVKLHDAAGKDRLWRKRRNRDKENMTTRRSHIHQDAPVRARARRRVYPGSRSRTHPPSSLAHCTLTHNKRGSRSPLAAHPQHRTWATPFANKRRAEMREDAR